MTKAQPGRGMSAEATFPGGVPNAMLPCVGVALIWSALTDAVSYTGPDPVQWTVIVKEALALTASEATWQVTVAPEALQPDEADTKVASVGSVSVTVTWVAISGPLFLTVNV